MCGRYYMGDNEDDPEVRMMLEEIDRRYQGKPERQALRLGEIYPTNVVPVYAISRKLTAGYFLMRWGIDAPNRAGLAININVETLLTALSKQAVAQVRRCVIPASYYYMWVYTDGVRVKYRLKPAGADMAYMAGVYSTTDGCLPAFAVVTCPAAQGVQHISRRMPLMLASDERQAWLNPCGDVGAVVAAAQDTITYEQVS